MKQSKYFQTTPVKGKYSALNRKCQVIRHILGSVWYKVSYLWKGVLKGKCMAYELYLCKKFTGQKEKKRCVLIKLLSTRWWPLVLADCIFCSTDCNALVFKMYAIIPTTLFSNDLETARRDFGTNQRPMGLTPVTGYLIMVHRKPNCQQNIKT